MEFDFIIVGAGSAGCVLANRLSANPEVSVCLLEAGPKDNHSKVQRPSGIGSLIKDSKLNWCFDSEPEPSQNNREIYCPRGKLLGGSSSINAMLYVRGQPQDYDHWASLGNEGWAWNDLLPYFIKSQHQERGKDALNGVGGPLNVADVKKPHPFNHRFIRAAEELGYPLNDDFNSEVQEGIGFYQVTQKGGQRFSAADAYLHPVSDRSNLTVIVGARVSALELEGERVIGLTYFDNDKKNHSLKARREVILSGGSINSPQVLMLSGIGPRADLEAQGIEVKHELPGVGQNLQEHVDVVLVNYSGKRGPIALHPYELLNNIKQAWLYWTRKEGMLASTNIEAGGFIKSTPEVETPDLQWIFVPAFMEDHGRDIIAAMRYAYSSHVSLLRPKSRGSVGLKDASPSSDPKIHFNMLSHEDDVRVMVDAVKQTRALLHAKAFDEYRTEEVYPGEDCQSDEDIVEFLKERANHIYHPVGTCKMGGDDMAVVDSSLRVHGLAGLRVVDASIMPTLISGNTNAPTMAIAEKASDLILAQNDLS